MILKNMRILKRFFILFLVIGVFSCDDDDVREVTLYKKGTADATASATTIEFGESIDYSSTATKVQTLEWSFDGGTPNTSFEANPTITYNVPGTYEAQLIIKFIDNTVQAKTFIIIVNGPDEPLPFGGTPVAIPGTIEAENYDLGGQGVAYNDTEADNLAIVNGGSPSYRDDDGIDVEVGGTQTNIGYSNTDEWVNYTVNVSEAGSYDFEFVVASGSTEGGASLKLQLFNSANGNITDLGETGDFANTGGWGVYTSIVVSGINLSAGNNTLRVFFTGGGTNFDKMIVTEAAGGGGGMPLGPINIAFATDNVASDQGYIDLLEAAGHTVTAGAQWANLDAAGASNLNTFDLVIISRNTNSGQFADAARPAWITVTSPILNMSAFVTRNNRLQNFDSDAFSEGAPFNIIATDESHPVFTGIDLVGGSTGDITTVPLHVAGISNAGNGTLIGTTPDGLNGAIAFWDANTASYAGADVFAAKRMFLAATAGGFTFNEIGSKLFLNCVEYIVTGTVFAGVSGPIDGLGFYTERETTESIEAERPPANSGNFNLSYVTDAAEGSEAIYGNYATTGTGNDVTWGAMISMYPSDGTNRVTLDVSAYNYYNISLKAPAENTSPIRLRFRTSGGNYWVTLNDEYGFVRDGQWHNLKIPLSDLKFDGAGAALDTDKASITEVIFRSDADVNGISANFDWYIDDIYFTVD